MMLSYLHPALAELHPEPLYPWPEKKDPACFEAHVKTLLRLAAALRASDPIDLREPDPSTERAAATLGVCAAFWMLELFSIAKKVDEEAEARLRKVLQLALDAGDPMLEETALAKWRDLKGPEHKRFFVDGLKRQEEYRSKAQAEVTALQTWWQTAHVAFEKLEGKGTDEDFETHVRAFPATRSLRVHYAFLTTFANDWLRFDRAFITSVAWLWALPYDPRAISTYMVLAVQQKAPEVDAALERIRTWFGGLPWHTEALVQLGILKAGPSAEDAARATHADPSIPFLGGVGRPAAPVQHPPTPAEPERRASRHGLIVKLPDAEEMMKRLTAGDDTPYYVEKLYPLFQKRAGAELATQGIVVVLATAVEDWYQAIGTNSPVLRGLAMSSMPVFIEAVIDDEEARAEALEFWRKCENPQPLPVMAAEPPSGSEP